MATNDKPVADSEQLFNDAHKLVTAEYSIEQLYCVPKDWNLKDISIKWGRFYYQGELKTIPRIDLDPDMKFPYTITEDLDSDATSWFDCEGSDEEEE